MGGRVTQPNPRRWPSVGVHVLAGQVLNARDKFGPMMWAPIANNIISILVLMVMEKVRDIGVLLAMGATHQGIRRIFLLQGLIIAAVGTLAGIVLGVALAWVLDRYHLISLPVDVYFIPYVPFHIRPLDVLMVALLTVGVSFLATLYPAWRAARLDPSEALRYE